MEKKTEVENPALQRWIDLNKKFKKEKLTDIQKDAQGYYFHHNSDPFNFRLRHDSRDQLDSIYTKQEWSPMMSRFAHERDSCLEREQENPSKFRWNPETSKCESFRRSIPIGDHIAKYGSLSKLIQALQQSILNAPPLPVDLEVWRGVSRHEKPILDKLAPSDIYSDQGFLSTTIRKTRAIGYIIESNADIEKKSKTSSYLSLCCLLKIRIPKGNNVLWDSWESQVLLPAGTRLKFVQKSREQVQIIEDLLTGESFIPSFPWYITVYEFQYLGTN